MNLYNSLLTGISASSLAQFIQSFLHTTTQAIVWQKNINLISNVNLISLLYLKPFNGSLLFVQIQSPEHCKLHDLALSLILHKTNYSFLSSYVMLFGLCTWNVLPYFTLVLSLLYHSLNCTHLLFGYTFISFSRMKAPGEQRPFFIYFWIPKK